MNDINLILQAISTVGFPILACVGMFYMYDRIMKDLTITLTEINTTLIAMRERLDKIEGVAE